MSWLLAMSVLAEGGSGLTREDWLARIPVAIAVFAIVAAVDTVVFTRTIRALRRRA